MAPREVGGRDERGEHGEHDEDGTEEPGEGVHEDETAEVLAEGDDRERRDEREDQARDGDGRERIGGAPAPERGLADEHEAGDDRDDDLGIDRGDVRHLIAARMKPGSVASRMTRSREGWMIAMNGCGATTSTTVITSSGTAAVISSGLTAWSARNVS